MAKKEISYKQVLQLQVEANTFLFNKGYINEKGELTDKPQPKIVPAIKNVLKQTDKIMAEYNDELDNLRLDHCLVDEKTKAVLKDEKGNYRFSVDGTKKLKADIKKLLEEKVEIHQRIVQDSEVDPEEYESFIGILIPEIEPKENES